MSEAVALMKREFGRDAVVLDTKRLKQGGFFGLFGQPYFEIVGAIDENNRGAIERTSQPAPGPRRVEQPKTGSPITIQLPNFVQQTPWSATIQGLYNELTNLSLSHDIALELIKTTLSQVPKEYWEELAYLKEQMLSNISGQIVVEQSWDLKNQRKIMALVGPTGVGKTTTIAKIAAKYQLESNARVGLVTLDTYRMAAVEQLKTYAEIIGIPLVVAYNLEDLEQAIASMADKDLVLVDTAGRSHLNESQMQELELILHALDAETYLAINACTKNEDLTSIISAYSDLKIDRLIITKLDETSGFGILLQAPLLAKIPIAFVTTGQSVPDDIELAGANNIIKLVLGD